MTFKQWNQYFSKLTVEQRYALYKAYETQKADPEIYKAYKYDIDNLMYLLDSCGI